MSSVPHHNPDAPQLRLVGTPEHPPQVKREDHPGLELTIGNRTLAVQIDTVDNPHLAVDELGLSEESSGLITLASADHLPPEHRLEVLAHEFCHFFEWSFGSPSSDPEERADQFATAFVMLNRQVEAWGGEAALIDRGA